MLAEMQNLADYINADEYQFNCTPEDETAL